MELPAHSLPYLFLGMLCCAALAIGPYIMMKRSEPLWAPDRKHRWLSLEQINKSQDAEEKPD